MINTYDPKHYTLICELFNACNLHCKFCVKNTKTPDLSIDIPYIIETLPNDLRREVLPELTKRQVSTLLFNMYGGEILMDSLEDEFFEAYVTLRKIVTDMVHEYLPTCKVYCNIVTNAVFEKRERVLKLLKDLDANLNISYDPTGRYTTNHQLYTVRRNIEYFRQAKKLNLITFTLTKPTIKYFLNNPDDLFMLPRDITLDVSYYLPMNNNNEELMPSDDEVFEFYKMCLDKRIFNVSEINNFLTEYIDPSREIHSYCHNAKITSKVDGKTVFNNCCADMVKNFYLKGEQEYYGENYNILSKLPEKDKRHSGKLKRQCLYCQYEDRCPGMCFIAILWHGTQISACPIQRIFNYLGIHPEIVADYRETDTSMLKR